MDASHVSQATGRHRPIVLVTRERGISSAGRVVLVAALTGCAVVALGMRAAPDPDEIARARAAAAEAASRPLPVPGAVYYFPDLYVDGAATSGGNVMTYEHQ